MATLAGEASRLAEAVVTGEEKSYSTADRRLDKVLTGRRWGIPIMLGLLAVIFWMTISGANLPSALLAKGLFRLQDLLSGALLGLGVPLWLHDALILGVYRVAAWVVSVMLPPMAIFFPLFTLLEDMGYLPRVAYNLDRPLKRCGACGKQALTICMGFGCNAAGVVGCRIIDSPRERLLAILTNSFVPCNGRFPTLVNLILLFFVGTAAGPGQSVLSALLLTGFILLGAAATFAVTGILSRTVLRGVPSSFTLELPPYRMPTLQGMVIHAGERTWEYLKKAGTVILAISIVVWAAMAYPGLPEDRVQVHELTLAELQAQLGNAAPGSAQYGALEQAIQTENGRFSEETLRHTIAGRIGSAMKPVTRYAGFGWEANISLLGGLAAKEVIVTTLGTAYSLYDADENSGSLADFIAKDKNWTIPSVVSFLLFVLLYAPCFVSLVTIRMETGSAKWALFSFVFNTCVAMLVATTAYQILSRWS